MSFVSFVFLTFLEHVAIRTGTGGNAPHTGEELQGTRVLNSSGGTRKLTRLTSKYVLQGKTKKAKIIISYTDVSITHCGIHDHM